MEVHEEMMLMDFRSQNKSVGGIVLLLGVLFLTIVLVKAQSLCTNCDPKPESGQTQDEQDW